MKHRSITVVLLLALASLVTVAAPTGPAGAAVPVTHTFGFTGAVSYWTVPWDVTSVDVFACGAEGGSDSIAGAGSGGLGGRAFKRLTVTPGETLAIYVGGSGDAPSPGWNGGGAGLPYGGGASDVRQGGQTLAHRVVVGGGGSGGGWVYDGFGQFTLVGGYGGGGLSGRGTIDDIGRGTSGGTQTEGGIPNGSLGVGGDASGNMGGGGGGLYGGGGGFGYTPGEYPIYGWAGGSGSGLGDSFETGVCEGNGSVKLSYETDPAIRPFGVLVFSEGDCCSTTWRLPVYLTAPSDVTVTVDWSTVATNGVGLASAGPDFTAASGTLTFAPGDTVEYVPIKVRGDTVDEAPLLWGEWGLVRFSNPVNAPLDTQTFFGHGLFIIVDDD